MKYIIKNGKFVAKTTDENLNAVEPKTVLAGKIVGFREIHGENGPDRVQIDFKGEGEDAPVETLSVKKYGDASLKILRCLFGIADVMAGKDITLELVEREGQSSLIKVSADGEELTPSGYVEPYAYDKKLLTDKIVSYLGRCNNYRSDILIYGNEDGVLSDDPEEIADYIRDLRRAGRGSELLVRKNGFTNQHVAAGYRRALTEMSGIARFRVFSDAEDIELIWGAFTEELPSDDGSVEVPATDENGREIER